MLEPVRTLTADRGDAGQRLDLVLRRHLTNVRAATRTRVQRWIADGLVTINGTQVTRSSVRTMPGDIVRITVPEAHQPRPVTAEPMPLVVLYEDNELMVVDKPAGVVVHPTYRNYENTIMNGLLWHAREWTGARRPSLVGRLDKMTSGLMLVAKSPAVHRLMQQAGHAGAIDKDYLAIVYGRLSEPSSIDLPIAGDPRDRRRFITTATGAPSMTRVSPLASATVGGIAISLLRCRLVTGRTHQIRVHLSASDLPIVGDPVYGRSPGGALGSGTTASLLQTFGRQALHSWRLSFPHPGSGARISIEASIPADMQGVIDSTGLAPVQ